MKDIKLAMYKQDLQDVEESTLDKEFSLRLFSDDDRYNWAEILTSVAEFTDVESALKHFKKEFSLYIDQMKKRCVFLIAPDGETIGTVTAWFGNFQGELTGRIHWVAIKPKYQGKGLAKPMLSFAMNILKSRHNSAYLTTQPKSFKAISMYKSFGFKPVKRFPEDPDFYKGWETVDNLLIGG